MNFGGNAFGARPGPSSLSGGATGGAGGGTSFGASNNFGAGATTTNAFGASATGAFGTAAAGGFGTHTAAAGNPFGAGSTTTGFGSTTGTTFGATTGGAFGANASSPFAARQGAATTSSPFGATPGATTTGFGAPAVGGGAVGGFGAAPQQSGNMFGTGTAAQNASSGFGASSFTGFGAQQPQQQTGLGMTGAFGSAPTSMGGMGVQGQGTGNPPFSPHPTTETQKNQTTHLKVYNISATASYQNKSQEELRLEDYRRGNKGPGTAGMAGTGMAGGFGMGQQQQQQQQGAPLFGGTSTFGAGTKPATTGFGATAPSGFGATSAPNAFGSQGGTGTGTQYQFRVGTGRRIIKGKGRKMGVQGRRTGNPPFSPHQTTETQKNQTTCGLFLFSTEKEKIFYRNTTYFEPHGAFETSYYQKLWTIATTEDSFGEYLDSFWRGKVQDRNTFFQRIELQWDLLSKILNEVSSSFGSDSSRVAYEDFFGYFCSFLRLITMAQNNVLPLTLENMMKTSKEPIGLPKIVGIEIPKSWQTDVGVYELIFNDVKIGMGYENVTRHLLPTRIDGVVIEGGNDPSRSWPLVTEITPKVLVSVGNKRCSKVGDETESEAYKYGVREGDIIVAINETPVESFDDFQVKLSAARRPLKLRFLRLPADYFDNAQEPVNGDESKGRETSDRQDGETFTEGMTKKDTQQAIDEDIVENQTNATKMGDTTQASVEAVHGSQSNSRIRKKGSRKKEGRTNSSINSAQLLIIRRLIKCRNELNSQQQHNQQLRIDHFYPATATLCDCIRRTNDHDSTTDSAFQNTADYWLQSLDKVKSDYEECVKAVDAALEEHQRVQTDEAVEHYPNNQQHQTNVVSAAMEKFTTDENSTLIPLVDARETARMRWHDAMERLIETCSVEYLESLRERVDGLSGKAQSCLLELHVMCDPVLADIEEIAMEQDLKRLLADALNLDLLKGNISLTEIMEQLLMKVDSEVDSYKQLITIIEESKSRMCCCTLKVGGMRSSCGGCSAIPVPSDQQPHDWYVSRWIGQSLSSLGSNFQSLKKDHRQAEKALTVKLEELKDFHEDNPYADMAAVKAFERSISVDEARQQRHVAKRRLVEARSYLAQLALGPYREVLYALPLVGLKSVELPDIAERFLVPDRSFSDYEDVELISSSGRHSVYRAMLGGRVVVLKEYQISHDSHSEHRSFWRETRLLSRLSSHESFVDIKGVFTEVKSGRLYAYIEMPFYRNGNLQNFMDATAGAGQPLSTLQRLAMLRSIISAIAFLHGEGVLHCDIKPENILVTDSGRPVMADFDIARDANERATMVTTTAAVRGTLGYMAPELRQQPPSDPSEKSDIFSFGQLALAMLSIEDIETSMETKLQELLRICTSEDPDQRPTAAEILRMPGVFPEEATMIHMLNNLQAELQEFQSSMDEKDAEIEARRIERCRTCCVCGDELDVSLGMECCNPEYAAMHGVRAHFHCDDCFSNLVKHEVSQHWLQLRWVEVLVNGEVETKRIRRRVDAIHNLNIPKLDEERFAQAFRDMETNLWYDLSGFRGAFDVVNIHEDEICFPCSYSAPAPEECQCFFNNDDVARHINSHTSVLYRGALQDLRAHRECHRLRVEWEEEKRRLEAASRLDRLKRKVEEDILNSKCPACGQALGEGAEAFEACAALRCKVADNIRGGQVAVGCGAAFCAFCLEPCGRDAHEHVRRCRYNPQPGSYFVSADAYKRAVKERQIRQLREFLRELEQPTRSELIEALSVQLGHLNIDKEALRV